MRIERTSQEPARGSLTGRSWRGEVPMPPPVRHGLSVEDVDRRFNEEAKAVMEEFDENPSQRLLQKIDRMMGHALAFWQGVGAVSKKCHEMGMALIGNLKG